MTEETENLVLSILRDIRKEQTEQRSLLLSVVDYRRKMEQRIDARIAIVENRVVAVRDDLELMLKSELLGRLTHFGNTLDQRMGALSDRISPIEA